MILVRADSAYYAGTVVSAALRAGAFFSITDMSAIRVFITEPPRQATIPAILEGYLVEVITAGEITASH
jgi:hypothetical protein